MGRYLVIRILLSTLSLYVYKDDYGRYTPEVGVRSLLAARAALALAFADGCSMEVVTQIGDLDSASSNGNFPAGNNC